MATRYSCGVVRHLRRFPVPARWRVHAVAWLGLTLGCIPLEPLPTGVEFPFSISVLKPTEDAFVSPGGSVRIEWIDEGMEEGAQVFIEAISTDVGTDEIKVVILEGRDAQSDGDADTFDWNGTDPNGNGLPARSYRILGVLENPDGQQDLRPAVGEIVIPFSFVGTGAGGQRGILMNGSGSGPFVLQDNGADFLGAGVGVGATVHILGGSGSVTSTYTVSAVTATRLTLQADAGDSGGEDDVRYLVRLSNPRLQDTDDLVTIVWEDAEYASSSTIRLEVDPDTDADNDNESTIRDGIGLGSDGTSDMFDWDGTDTDGARVSSGQYYVRAVLNPGTGDELRYLFSDRIRVTGVGPSLELTQPASDTSPAAGGTVTIAWTDSDPDDDATITLLIDPDTDVADPGHSSGNEVQFKTGISEDSTTDTFDWETAGSPEGTYTVVGRITDGAGTTVTSSAPGRVTLQNSPPVLKWVRPEGTAANIEDNNRNGPFRLIDSAAGFSTTTLAVRNLVFQGNTVEIIDGTDVTPGDYTVDEDPTSATEVILSTNPGDSGGAGDVEYRITGTISLVRGTNPVFDFKTHDPEENSATLDLFLDFDEDRTNGNEIRILTNRAVSMNNQAQDDSFTWTGTKDTGGTTVDPGHYRLFGELDDGNPGGRPVTAAFEGNVLLRTGAGEPVVTLLSPGSDVTGTVGQTIQIDWDDRDADTNTTITLRYDDDAMPNEVTETDSAEVTIVSGIDADEDPGDPGVGGNPDQFLWDWHPADINQPAVGEGEYYIFAYIGNNGNPVTGPDMISVALGKVTINNTGPELEFTTPGSSNAEIPSPVGGNFAWNQRDADGDTISVDLWLDTDGNFEEDANKEIQIADSYTGGSPYAWNGQDRFGTAVETGQYTLVAVLNDGQSDESTETAIGLVNFRPDANSAVIVMASQFEDSTVNTDGSLTISWRDITVSGNEIVELYYDDDQTNTDDLGTLIEGNINAALDGSLDSFSWDLNSNVAVGDYYVHARIRASLPSDTDADVASAGFTLTDADADFVTAGVQAGDKVRIFSGTGATAGVYTIAGGGVTATVLTFTADPGDSGGAGDVSYSVGELDVSTSRGKLSVESDATTTFTFVTPTSVGVDVALGAGPVNITWDYTSPDAGTVTLKADPDNTNNNGNESTILDNRTQAAAPNGSSDSLSWDLQDTTPAALPTGEYIIRGVFNVPGSGLLNRQADGPVRIRKTATAPLVELTSPTSDKSYDQGDDPAASSPIQITWEVDDPSPSTVPKVDLWFDEQQSPEPSAGELADGAALGTLAGTAGAIVEDIDASTGAYTWTPPQSITATADKTFYIHIRIRDGALPADDDRTTAVGKIKINP